jgi:hypothetical protein
LSIWLSLVAVVAHSVVEVEAAQVDLGLVQVFL